MSNIFAIRGTITKENWPEANKLPDFMEFSQMAPKDLGKTFPMMSKQAVDLLEKML
jgi:cyclin-dependent kinase 7